MLSLQLENISATAKIAAYLRKGGGIPNPFAEKMSDLCMAGTATRDIFPGLEEFQAVRAMSPIVILRWLSLTFAVKAGRFPQVVEIASGLSTRGMFISHDESIQYLETDSAALFEEKKKVVNKLLEEKERPNLRFIPFNILDLTTHAITDHLEGEKPMAIIHERLFQDLNAQEKMTAGSNIQSLFPVFRSRESVWITSDVPTRAHLHVVMKKQQMRKIISGINGLPAPELLNNCFNDSAHAESFFRKLGFQVERKRQLDFVSSALFDHRSFGKDMQAELERQDIWFMRP